ncbi:hypothetical protein [Cohnella terricola]|uniref:Uncharacterized protein n=1 Tax=Cohnella terricola TaxID=1289167 RepID=A0A559J9Z5_9BACL|nr:hypothetical protein [Cohnella terricola]TVX96686.1 hypothetical protein FPZ45_20610 [Cohnella terricola]
MTHAKVRLKEISVIFPGHSQSEMEWNRAFRALFMEIPNQNLTFYPTVRDHQPMTSFRTKAVGFLEIKLHTTTPISARIGKLNILNNADAHDHSEPHHSEKAEVNHLSHSNPNTIQSVYSRLKGYLVGIDHTGVNIPMSIMSRDNWEQLLSDLSPISNLYRYPGEEWPFIIPANEEEFRHDIIDFTENRNPKFEWVYDRYASVPILQFALVTDLSKHELEEAFPAPIGFAIPGLEDIFRSIIIDSPWREDLEIRFDLYYKRNQSNPTEWETGEWLVKEGGRIV